MHESQENDPVDKEIIGLEDKTFSLCQSYIKKENKWDIRS